MLTWAIRMSWFKLSPFHRQGRRNVPTVKKQTTVTIAPILIVVATVAIAGVYSVLKKAAYKNCLMTDWFQQTEILQHQEIQETQ